MIYQWRSEPKEVRFAQILRGAHAPGALVHAINHPTQTRAVELEHEIFRAVQELDWLFGVRERHAGDLEALEVEVPDYFERRNALLAKLKNHVTQWKDNDRG